MSTDFLLDPERKVWKPNRRSFLFLSGATAAFHLLPNLVEPSKLISARWNGATLTTVANGVMTIQKISKTPELPMPNFYDFIPDGSNGKTGWLTSDSFEARSVIAKAKTEYEKALKAREREWKMETVATIKDWKGAEFKTIARETAYGPSYAVEYAD